MAIADVKPKEPGPLSGEDPKEGAMAGYSSEATPEPVRSAAWAAAKTAALEAWANGSADTTQMLIAASRAVDAALRTVVAKTMPALPGKTALDQIAELLGLWHSDLQDNPAEEVLTTISGHVAQTGRSIDVPEGA